MTPKKCNGHAWHVAFWVAFTIGTVIGGVIGAVLITDHLNNILFNVNYWISMGFFSILGLFISISMYVNSQKPPPPTYAEEMEQFKVDPTVKKAHVIYEKFRNKINSTEMITEFAHYLPGSCYEHWLTGMEIPGYPLFQKEELTHVTLD